MRGKSAAILILSVLLAAGMSYYYFGLFLPRVQSARAVQNLASGYAFGADFYPIWLTSRECLQGRHNPYDSQVTREIQRGLFGRTMSRAIPGDPPSDYRAFSYPAFVSLLGVSVAWLPFAGARMVVALLLAFLNGASVFLWTGALRWKVSRSSLIVIVILVFSSYPVLEGLYAGQIGLFVGFLMAAVFFALNQDSQYTAGALLALTTMKPQVSMLLILYLLLWAGADWKRRRTFALTFLITAAALFCAPLPIWPHWPLDWVHTLLNYGNYSRPPLLPDLFGPYAGTVLTILLLAIAFRLAWKNRRVPPSSPEFALTVAVLLALTVLILLPEHAVYDHVILLPGIILVIRHWHVIWQRSAVVRSTLAIAAAAFFWPWMAALFVGIAYVVAPQQASALMLVPLRTAAAIPFLVLGILLFYWRFREREIGEPGSVANS